MSGDFHWIFDDRKPSEDLQKWVEAIWGLEHPPGSAMPGVIVPDGLVEFVFHLGCPWTMRIGAGLPVSQPRAFALGQRCGSLSFSSSEQGSLVAFRAHASVAAAFLHDSIGDRWDAPIDLETLLPGTVPRLLDALAEGESLSARLDVLEQFIVELLSGINADALRVAGMAKWLMTTGRIESVPDAAKQLGLTQRTLNRLIANWSGLKPRELQILGRTLEACKLLRNTPLNAGAIAQAAGFYDHPAFCRQFRQLTGFSPIEFRRLPHAYWMSL